MLLNKNCVLLNKNCVLLFLKVWEENASRHVSIRTHLDEVTDLIVRWRKLELGQVFVIVFFLTELEDI